jgi:SAM-dependent methyltransferase
VRPGIFPWKTLFHNSCYTNHSIRPAVKALGMHMCQTMVYDWVLNAVEVRGRKVLDFGCSDYPLATFLAKLGAEAWWHDRDEALCKRQAERCVAAGVKTHRLDGTAPKFDVAIASNALQHNRNGGADALADIVGRLAPGGKVCIAEKVTGCASRWDDKRPDPCWVRSMADHRSFWNKAGLKPVIRQNREAISFLQYSWDRDVTAETGKYVLADEANEMCALLEKAS